MEKLIQPVKEVYSKFVFDKQTPSYVEIYTKKETDAVIVYSKIQEVIIGHVASPCNAIWKSVCALNNINQLLVEMTAAGVTTMPLDNAFIRVNNPNIKQPNNSKRLTELLNETEMYTYTAECPLGGCICVTEDTTSLRQCMSIDVNNKSYLSKLVLKLSRGHSQTSKVLKNLKSSPAQALSLVGQVGIEKTMWEYTKIMSLLEHSFFIAGIWHTDNRSNESIEQINQTIQDMTMGDTLNPFENLTSTEHSIRLDTESICIDDENELTVDDFTSLKKHGLVNERKDVNEPVLIWLLTSNNMNSKRKLKTLTLREKFNVIYVVKSGTKKKDVAARYGLPASTLYTIIMNEAEILQRYESSTNLSCKRRRLAEFPDLEEFLLTWLKQCRNKNISLSGPILISYNFGSHWDTVRFVPAMVDW
ncbi:unnamed protein product [Danaus chrysippus]|uniref:(African queen) hypothetical protein n=1 Tax=Danaus chrysippus TaxID=151541 RepID=A0A8J2R0Y2_9NEOP|nr:unnamed protein product [Danaus chrysippus]